MEIQAQGSINIGNVKNNKFNSINSHIGNWSLLKTKCSSTDSDGEFRRFSNLIKFCFQHLGKNALDSLNKTIDGFFRVHERSFFLSFSTISSSLRKVTHGNPVGIELLYSQQRCSLSDILSRYFKFIANSVWMQLGVKV